MKDEYLTIRMTTEIKERLRAVAQENGVSMGHYIHQVLRSIMSNPQSKEWHSLLLLLGQDPGMRNILFWFDMNKRCMESFGHVLPEEDRQIWADFMRRLGQVIAEKSVGVVKTERQKVEN